MTTYKADSWVNAHGPLGGAAAHVRKNVSLSIADAPRFPFTLLVSLIYHSKAPDGLPADEGELLRLDRSEEAVADRLCEDLGARFALCVTSGGTRDLFFFNQESVSEEAVDELIQSADPEVDYDVSIISDPTWGPYRQILPNECA